MEKLLTVAEIAILIGVKKSTIYQWTHQDYIRHIKLGNLVRFKPNQIEKWLDKKACLGSIRRVPAINI
jgi:excisionase family DNA binding protein